MAKSGKRAAARNPAEVLPPDNSPTAQPDQTPVVPELRWHPVDEYLNPLIAILRKLHDPGTTVQDLYVCRDLPESCPAFKTGLMVFRQQNQQFVYDELMRHVQQFRFSLESLFRFADAVKRGDVRAFYEQNSTNQADEIEAIVLEDGRSEMRRVAHHADVLVSEALVVSLTFRTKPEMRPVNADPGFTPTQLQRDIIGRLLWKAATADNLEFDLAVSRSVLFGGQRGGLNELVRQGWVDNSRKLGGYHLPFAPPTESN